MASVIARSTMVSDNTTIVPVEGIEPLDAIFDKLDWSDIQKENAVAFINGHRIDIDRWETTLVSEKDHALFVVIPAGGDGSGKQILAVVSMIALSMFTMGQSAWALAGLNGGALTGNALIAARIGVTIAGSMAINAIFKPPTVDPVSARVGTPLYSIQPSSNSITPFGIVPVLYGTMVITPPYAAEPRTINQAGEQYTAMLFALGHGSIVVREDTEQYGFGLEKHMWFGTTSIDEMNQQLSDKRIKYGIDVNSKTPGLAWFGNDYHTETLSVDLDKDEVLHYATDTNSTQSIIIHFSLPVGLYERSTSSKGDPIYESLEVGINIELDLQDGDGFKAITPMWYNVAHPKDIYSAMGYQPGDEVSIKCALLVEKQWHTVSATGGESDIYGVTRVSRFYADKRKVGGIQYIATNELIPAGNGDPKVTILDFPKNAIANLDSYTLVGFQNLPDGYKYVYKLDFNSSSGISEAGSQVSSTVYGGDIYNTNASNSAFWEIGFFINVVVGTSVQTAFRFKGNTSDGFYLSTKIPMPPGGVVSPGIRIKPHDQSARDKLVRKIFCVGIETQSVGQSLNLDRPQSFIEVLVPSDGNLQGQLQQFKVFAQRRLDVEFPGAPGRYDDDYNRMRTPADAYISALSGPEALVKIPDESIDFDTLLDWKRECQQSEDTNPSLKMPPAYDADTAPGGMVGRRWQYKFDIYITAETTLNEILKLIASSGVAIPTFKDDKYSVVFDTDGTLDNGIESDIPTQIITPANSWDLNAVVNYIDPPDVLRVKYLDEISWQEEEIRIPNPLKSDQPNLIDNYETVEDLNLPGITRAFQAGRMGRRYFASAIMEQESVTVKMDVENLACSVGNIVLLQSEAMNVSGVNSRVHLDSTILGPYLSGSKTSMQVRLYPFIDLPASDGKAKVRFSKGGLSMACDIVQVDIGRPPTEQWVQITDIMPVTDPNYDLRTSIRNISPGDLILIIQDSTNPYFTTKYRIKEILPEANFVASIKMLEYDATMYDVINDPSAQIERTPKTDGSFVGVQKPPLGFNIDAVYYLWGKEYYIKLILTITPPNGGAYLYKLFSNQADIIVDPFVKKKQTIDLKNLKNVIGVNQTRNLSFSIAAMSATGITSTKVNSSVTISPPPSPKPVMFLTSDYNDGIVKLEWGIPDDKYIFKFIIYHGWYTLNGTEEQTVTMAEVGSFTTSHNINVSQPGLHVFAVIAVSTWPTYSTPVYTEVFIQNMPNQGIELVSTDLLSDISVDQNIIHNLVWSLNPGNEVWIENAVNNEDNLFYDEAFYWSKTFLDLTYSEMIKLIPKLRIVEIDLNRNEISSTFSTKVEIWMYTNIVKPTPLNGSWYQPLSNADPFGAPTGAIDSYFDKVLNGERIDTLSHAKFVLKLIPNHSRTIAPRIKGAVVDAQRQYRRIIENDLETGTGTNALGEHQVTYPGEFAGGKPSVTVVGENMTVGDYYDITNNSSTGFLLKFYDSSGTPVNRRFDYSAVGYGEIYVP